MTSRYAKVIISLSPATKSCHKFCIFKETDVEVEPHTSCDLDLQAVKVLKLISGRKVMNPASR